jgi:hypothetical protein
VKNTLHSVNFSHECYDFRDHKTKWLIVLHHVSSRRPLDKIISSAVLWQTCHTSAFWEIWIFCFCSVTASLLRVAGKHIDICMKLVASQEISKAENLMDVICFRGHCDALESSCMKQLRWQCYFNVRVFPFTGYYFLFNMLGHPFASFLSQKLLLFVNKVF